jgi:hypothetical protein
MYEYSNQKRFSSFFFFHSSSLCDLCILCLCQSFSCLCKVNQTLGMHMQNMNMAREKSFVPHALMLKGKPQRDYPSIDAFYNYKSLPKPTPHGRIPII